MPTPPRDPARRVGARWTALLIASGAASLGYEVAWLRRLTLVLGGTAAASALTIGVFMGGLAIGGLLAAWLPRGHRAPRTYAALEAAAAGWAVAFPWLLGAAWPLVMGIEGARWVLATALLLPPTIALGATWPLLAQRAGPDLSTRLYAANTAGGVLGVLGMTFLLLPALGVRGAELSCAAVGVIAALVAWGHRVDR